MNFFPVEDWQSTFLRKSLQINWKRRASAKDLIDRLFPGEDFSPRKKWKEVMASDSTKEYIKKDTADRKKRVSRASTYSSHGDSDIESLTESMMGWSISGDRGHRRQESSRSLRGGRQDDEIASLSHLVSRMNIKDDADDDEEL